MLIGILFGSLIMIRKLTLNYQILQSSRWKIVFFRNSSSNLQKKSANVLMKTQQSHLIKHTSLGEKCKYQSSHSIPSMLLFFTLALESTPMMRSPFWCHWPSAAGKAFFVVVLYSLIKKRVWEETKKSKDKNLYEATYVYTCPNHFFYTLLKLKNMICTCERLENHHLVYRQNMWIYRNYGSIWPHCSLSAG